MKMCKIRCHKMCVSEFRSKTERLNATLPPRVSLQSYTLNVYNYICIRHIGAA